VGGGIDSTAFEMEAMLRRNQKTTALVFLLFSVFLLPLFAQSRKLDWLIVPGVRAGGITPKSRLSDLVATYGAKNVLEKDIDEGEGSFVKGAVIYPEDSNKMAELVWRDPEHKRFVQWIRWRGKKTVWKTVQGITLGTRLKEVERLNGKPFTVTGSGYDYSGTVISWQKGKLEKAFQANGRVILRLGVGRAPGLMVGDRELRSSHPELQKMNPEIDEIILEFK